MKLLKLNGQAIEKLYDRNRFGRKKRIEEKVRGIINDVQQSGDEAVLKYTRRFDHVKLTARELRVSEAEISGVAKRDHDM